MLQDIVCPSGLAGSIRQFQVGDLDAFLDRAIRNQPGPALEFELARRVWSQTSNRGPYLFDGVVPPWDGDVLTGDRFYVIVQARILARGSNYDLEVRCEECETAYTWTVDLTSLEVRRLSDESLASFRDGNRFTTKLPSGTTAVWGLPTGRSQRLSDRFVKEHGRSLAAIYASRLVTVEGVEPRNHMAWMKALDLRDFDALTGDMEQRDCGIETALETTCPSCGQVQVGDVSLGRGFFGEDRKAALRKRKK